LPGVDSPLTERLPHRPIAESGGPPSFWRWPAIPRPLTLILLVGAADFLWKLGSPSYFVDEVFSIRTASHALGDVINAARLSEFTPPTYYLFLHEWIGRTGSQAEWVVRLPSALAGVALVGAVYWMARAFLDRRGALAAAALCALSPLVLEYAQLVRAYVFAMLAVTVAVGATMRGVRTRSARTRMLSLGALAAVIALLLHYTSLLVIVPLCVWLATRRASSPRARAAFLGSCAVALLLIAPLFLHTYKYVPNGVLGASAKVTWPNIAHVAETPFDGRVAVGVDALTIVAAAAVIVSVIVLLVLPGTSFRERANAAVRDRYLLVALASVAPVVLLVAAFAGKSVLITRYSAVAAPFLITAVAAAVVSLPRPAAAALAAAALVPACVGVIVSHTKRGFYLPTRDAIDYIAAHQQRRELLAVPGSVGTEVPLLYYAARRLHPPLRFIADDELPRLGATQKQNPLWIVASLPGRRYGIRSLSRAASLALGRLGYRAQDVRTFTTSGTLVVVLALPRASPR